MSESAAKKDSDDLAGVPAAGDILAGKYRVEGILGKGGMGVVAAARHTQLGQRVAVKFLLPDMAAHPEPLARFQREARASVAITSEHVARVFDVGTLESGAPYMVMELLSGTDLEKMVRKRGRLPIGEAVDYVLQACEALAEAHSLGIVHRDLKPSNLFLARRADGSPLIKVLDFGIAKAMEGAASEINTSLTATGAIMGSPRYMSPEQVRDTKKIDQRTDVWGVGVVLHELVSGKPPFEADTVPALCAAVVADPATPLRQHRADAPAELESVVLRCLEKSRDSRFANVAELARALAPFAPASAGLSIERIAKVLGAGGGRYAVIVTGASESGRPPSHFVETLATPQSDPESPASPVAGAVALSSPLASTQGETLAAPDRAVVETSAAWDTGRRRLPAGSRQRTLAVVGAVVVVAGGGALAVWLGHDGKPAPQADPAPTSGVVHTTQAAAPGDTIAPASSQYACALSTNSPAGWFSPLAIVWIMPSCFERRRTTPLPGVELGSCSIAQ